MEPIAARRSGTDGHEEHECRDMLDVYLNAQRQHPGHRGRPCTALLHVGECVGRLGYSRY